MKICHCIKISDEEIKSLNVVRDMLRQIADDGLLDRDFNDEHDVTIDDLAAWFEDVIDFFEAWQ